MKKYIDLLDSSNLYGWKITEYKKMWTELHKDEIRRKNRIYREIHGNKRKAQNIFI